MDLPKRVLVSETLILESINKLYSPGFQKYNFESHLNLFFSWHLEKNENPRESSKSFLICENQKGASTLQFVLRKAYSCGYRRGQIPLEAS